MKLEGTKHICVLVLIGLFLSPLYAYARPQKKDFLSNIEPVFLFRCGRVVIIAYPSDAGSEEGEGNARAWVKTKAAWRYDVGQSSKHSLQLLHSLEAISGMKLISFLVPLSTNPTAFFFFTSAQYLTHSPQ